MSDQGAVRTIKVRLRFPPGIHVPSGAMLRLKIEDISAADRAAPVLSEQELRLSQSGEALVRIPAGLIDARASYSVFAHVDVSNNGRVEPGDFITPAINSVLTHGAPDSVEARLIRVGGD